MTACRSPSIGNRVLSSWHCLGLLAFWLCTDLQNFPALFAKRSACSQDSQHHICTESFFGDDHSLYPSSCDMIKIVNDRDHFVAASRYAVRSVNIRDTNSLSVSWVLGPGLAVSPIAPTCHPTQITRSPPDRLTVLKSKG